MSLSMTCQLMRLKDEFRKKLMGLRRDRPTTLYVWRVARSVTVMMIWRLKIAMSAQAPK